MEEMITPAEIAELYRVSRSTAQRWLKDLIDKNELLPIGYNPRLKRQPNPMYSKSDVIRVLGEPLSPNSTAA